MLPQAADAAPSARAPLGSLGLNSSASASAAAPELRNLSRSSSSASLKPTAVSSAAYDNVGEPLSWPVSDKAVPVEYRSEALLTRRQPGVSSAGEKKSSKRLRAKHAVAASNTFPTKPKAKLSQPSNTPAGDAKGGPSDVGETFSVSAHDFAFLFGMDPAKVVSQHQGGEPGVWPDENDDKQDARSRSGWTAVPATLAGLERLQCHRPAPPQGCGFGTCLAVARLSPEVKVAMEEEKALQALEQLGFDEEGSE